VGGEDRSIDVTVEPVESTTLDNSQRTIRSPAPADELTTSQPVPARTDVITVQQHRAVLFGDARAAVGQWLRGLANRPGPRFALPLLFIVVVLAVAGTAGGFVVPQVTPRTPNTAAVPEVTAVPDRVPQTGEAGPPLVLPTDQPSAVPLPGVGGRPADVLASWAVPLADRLQIPAVSLQAYGYAELVLTRTRPTCKLSWTTLAGIAKIESNHGRASNARLNPDGKSMPSIIGAPLDGQGGRQAIADTDSGQLDTDRTWDRAVGPMQFIPSTWRLYAVDADTDGTADINDVDDAALAAANYLCANNRDLSTPAGWMAAIGAYNAVNVYIMDVFAATNDYGQRSRS
jgi:hypothetical protein